MKIRLVLPLCLLILTLLASCVAPAVAPAAPAESTIAPTATEATTEAESETDAEVAVATGECEEGYRLFDHELLQGEPQCIPVNPERVLALDMASLEFLLLMGKTPVGTSNWMLSEFPVLLPQFADTLEGVPGVGYPAELEQVVLMQPDLILAPADTIDVEQASQIAPVIVPSQALYEDWKIGMEFWGSVLNASDLYAEMEENYWTRIDELQNALGDSINDEISVVSTSSSGMSLWMPDTGLGRIISDAGLSRTPAQSLVGDAAVAEYGVRQYIQISEERIDLVNGDAIFYFTYASADAETAKVESDYIQGLAQDPIWQSLDAVKAGRAYFVGGHWWRAQTYLLANLVIDDLFANLTETTATTPLIEIQQ